jgi:hypothetical protein
LLIDANLSVRTIRQVEGAQYCTAGTPLDATVVASRRRNESFNVPNYRVYKTTPDGHILGPALIIECADDQVAIGKAARAANG